MRVDRFCGTAGDWELVGFQRVQDGKGVRTFFGNDEERSFG